MTTGKVAEYIILVEGEVQGVGYRAFAQRQAVQSGLTGYAANLTDGRVEVMVQGDRDLIDGFIQALSAGPRLSRVAEITVTERVPTSLNSGFEVK